MPFKKQSDKNEDFHFPKLTRKGFLKLLTGTAVTVLCGDFFRQVALALGDSDTARPRPKIARKTDNDLAVTAGDDPYKQTRQAVLALGGMEKFVRPKDVVLIKPNIGWDSTPEQAADTNPFVVAALIDLCFEAGARRVNIFDNPCNEPRRCYVNSGIQDIARKHRANIFFPSSWNTLKAAFPYKSPMQDWPLFREALECDTFINVPVLKHHGLTRLTLSMKNLMGVCAGRRGKIHFDIGRKLVDLTDFINPDLTVIDAVRVLVRHGPHSSDPADVKLLKKVIAGTDPVLCDVFACRLMDVDPQEVPYLAEAISRGFGKHDLTKAKIKQV